MNKFGFLLAAGLALAGAAVHGAATHRWNSLAPATTRAGSLHELTVELGDYESEIVPTDFEIKEKSTVTCRRYVSPLRNAGAMISVTTGPTGAVATHTPNVCYPSSGYKTLTPMKRETITLPGGGTATFYIADFEKRTATGTDRQRVRWAWATPGGNWTAPDSPRFAFLNSPELYKIYVVSTVPGTDAPEADPPAVTAFVAAAFARFTTAAAQ